MHDHKSYKIKYLRHDQVSQFIGIDLASPVPEFLFFNKVADLQLY